MNFQTDWLYIYKGIKNNPSCLKTKQKQPTTKDSTISLNGSIFQIVGPFLMMIYYTGVWGGVGIQGLTGVSRSYPFRIHENTSICFKVKNLWKIIEKEKNEKLVNDIKMRSVVWAYMFVVDWTVSSSHLCIFCFPESSKTFKKLHWICYMYCVPHYLDGME